MLGPLQRCTIFKSSPLSLGEKSTSGQFWLLRNLSYPYDDKSVYFNIPKHCTAVKYATLQDAVKMIWKLGPGCFLAKSDINSAFGMVPDCYHLMGFKWELSYYFNKCLPMGLAEFSKILEIVSDAIVCILYKKCSISKT